MGSCKVCVEKERLIDVLSKEIDWLRAQIGSPTLATANNPSELLPVTMTEVPYMNEDEEDVRHMVATGQIDEANLPEILEALGFANTEVQLAP